jgi:aminopeptidase-like protein
VNCSGESMNFNATHRELANPANVGDEIYALAAEIFPICRSITGDGVRETLRLIGRHMAIEVHEVPSGTKVFDWTVPKEWNIRDAHITDGNGERIVDFSACNLHVVGYSVPVRKRVSLAALKEHLHTIPSQPDLIPYRTAYDAESWGFCISHSQFEKLRDEFYNVVIDSTLQDGSLTYGECLIKGGTEDEILLCTHICHPSLATEGCSSLALLTQLAKRVCALKTRYSYRFLFAPSTIGTITWLARNENRISRIKHGLVLANLGDGAHPVYKKSRRGNADVDRASAHVLKHSGMSTKVIDFSPIGYDERQFCSPGFNLPIGLLQRSVFGEFSEYHTSADNLGFIQKQHLEESYRIVANILNILENDFVYVNTTPKCEPQLGRRGLYAGGGCKDAVTRNLSNLWVLNLTDGAHSILDIAERADLPFYVIADSARILAEHQLLVRQSSSTNSSPAERSHSVTAGQCDASNGR